MDELETANREPSKSPSRGVRILLMSFAYGPGSGSEPGNCWAWSLAASTIANVDVITTTRYRDDIDAVLSSLGTDSLQVHYVDPPRFARRGGLLHLLSYRAWKGVAAKKLYALHALEPYDIVHHLSYGNVWFTPIGGELGVPFVVGPLNGGPRVPLSLYPLLGLRGGLRESARLVFRLVRSLDPRVRRAWSRADVVVAANHETIELLSRDKRQRARLQTNSITTTSLTQWREERRPDANSDVAEVVPKSLLAAGRLLPWKGFALALYALKELPDWRLTVVGGGPDERRIERLSARLGVTDRLTRVRWLPQGELWELMMRSQVVLVPSLRDDGPCLLTEALVLGRPVVALDQGLARNLKGRLGVSTVSPTSPRRTARRVAHSVNSAPHRATVELDDLVWENLPKLQAAIYAEAVSAPRCFSG
ncbi:MAG: hypothetical protein C5B48_05620 [Candidatus Rokuibacteriota bacterium]|nr:MAG: hypothetical protein C5B48_05620 [Candidatus Rokubacteria bacterium]